MGCPPFVRRGPDRSRDDATARTAASRVSTVSRSWIAAGAVSIHPELSSARVSDSSRSNSSSPLSRLQALSASARDRSLLSVAFVPESSACNAAKPSARFVAWAPSIKMGRGLSPPSYRPCSAHKKGRRFRRPEIDFSFRPPNFHPAVARIQLL